MCLTTGAVYIETVKFLDSDDFLCDLMRFTALRGGIKRIRSDNGGNYVGAERELRELVQAWDSERITPEMSVKGVDWSFQPPLASSQSGDGNDTLKNRNVTCMPYSVNPQLHRTYFVLHCTK